MEKKEKRGDGGRGCRGDCKGGEHEEDKEGEEEENHREKEKHKCCKVILNIVICCGLTCDAQVLFWRWTWVFIDESSSW